VLGTLVWGGVLIAGTALLLWADRNDERVFAAKLESAVAWLEPPVGVAGPLLLLVTGIWLVIDGPWGFGDLWVAVGIVGYAAALALGAGFEGPVGRRFRGIVRERGPDDPEAIALGRRLQAVGYGELGILLVVVLAMTTKPQGSGSVGFWVVAGAIVGGASALAIRMSGRAAAAAP
jgi:hypothetical protein